MTPRSARRILLCYLPLGALAIAASAYFTRPDRCSCTLSYTGPASTFAEYADGVRGLDVPEDCPLHGGMTP